MPLREMKNRLVMIAVALGVFVLDQMTKLLIQSSMTAGQSRPVWGNLIRLTYINNPNGLMGVSFGPWSRHLMLPLSLLAIAAIIYFYYRWQNRSSLAATAMGMILAGAAGNMLDRFRFGSVIDFIDCDFPDIMIPPFKLWFVNFGGYGLERWYIFNVADSAVLMGVCLLLLLTFLGSEPGKPAAAPAGGSPPQP